MELFNQKLEKLLGIGIDDYPSTAYSLIETRLDPPSRHPNYYSHRYLEQPIFGLFDKIEVMTQDNLTNRHMRLISQDFDATYMNQLVLLVNSLTDIYGADEKRNLWFREDEEEAVLNFTWQGRDWGFPFDEDIWAVVLFIENQMLSLSIHEVGWNLDF